MNGTALRQKIADADGDPAKLERLVWESHRDATDTQALLDDKRAELLRAEADRDRAVSRAAAVEREKERQAEDAKVQYRRAVAALDQQNAKAAAAEQDGLEAGKDTCAILGLHWIAYVSEMLYGLTANMAVEIGHAFPDTPNPELAKLVKKIVRGGIDRKVANRVVDYIDLAAGQFFDAHPTQQEIDTARRAAGDAIAKNFHDRVLAGLRT